MRNKRLIILLSVLGGMAVLIIVMSAIFTVYHVEARCISRYSDIDSVTPVSAEVAAVAEEEVKYQNIFLFDEEELLEQVNLKVARAEAVDVECKFPNTVQVKYKLVNEDIQIQTADGYLVAGSSGKIIISDDVDRTDISSGTEYNDSLIKVTPYIMPDNSQVGKYLYNDKAAYDLTALGILLEYSSLLVDPDTFNEVFRPSYESIDLSSTSVITVTMKSGLIFKLNSLSSARFDKDTESLKAAVTAMVGWYVDVATDDQKKSGTVTVNYNADRQEWICNHRFA